MLGEKKTNTYLAIKKKRKGGIRILVSGIRKTTGERRTRR